MENSNENKLEVAAGESLSPIQKRCPLTNLAIRLARMAPKSEGVSPFWTVTESEENDDYRLFFCGSLLVRLRHGNLPDGKFMLTAFGSDISPIDAARAGAGLARIAREIGANLVIEGSMPPWKIAESTLSLGDILFDPDTGSSHLVRSMSARKSAAGQGLRKRVANLIHVVFGTGKDVEASGDVDFGSKDEVDVTWD